ncbi:MAG: hypothetical protein U5J78_01695 [Parasphingorhabdus sp.]|nr:hypothetical protein [Parasphingorhabdus sp.]
MKYMPLTLLLPIFVLAACSGSDDAPGGDAVTETQMQNMDVLDGTISDEMPITDNSQRTNALVAPSEDSAKSTNDDAKTPDKAADDSGKRKQSDAESGKKADSKADARTGKRMTG